jgi:glucose-1-phosphate adenylyltransferase
VRPRVLVLVLAGGAGGRLELLTEQRAKPAVPYAGSYTLIDVPLSNCLHSAIADVWVVEQYNPASLADHLANGRPWDLDRTVGGLMVLHPHQGAGKSGWHSGTADAVWRQAGLVREADVDALVVVSADAVYRLDYRDVVDEHLAGGAAVTMVTTRVDSGDAGRYGVVQVDAGRVVDYAYKPDEPASDLVSNEVFVLDPRRVLDLLDELAEDAGDDGLGDLGDALLPALVGDGAAREHRFEGYWRDLGTVQAYWQAHQDLVRPDPPFRPDDAERPLVSRPDRHGPARVRAGASVHDSLLAPGSAVAGIVERSVLSPDVVVEDGAVVRDSVLLPGVVVRSGAVVERAVMDEGVEVGREARVGGDGEVTLVGCRERLEPSTAVSAGGRVPDPD